MLDDNSTTDTTDTIAAEAPEAPRRRRAASRPAGPPVDDAAPAPAVKTAAKKAGTKKAATKKTAATKATTTKATATKSPAKRATSKTTTKTAAKKGTTKNAAKQATGMTAPADNSEALPDPPTTTADELAAAADPGTGGAAADLPPTGTDPSTPTATGGLFSAAETHTTPRRRRSRRAATRDADQDAAVVPETAGQDMAVDGHTTDAGTAEPTATPDPATPLFQPADPSSVPRRRPRSRRDEGDTESGSGAAPDATSDRADRADDTDGVDESGAAGDEADGDGSSSRRRRRRGGRRRRKAGGDDEAATVESGADRPAAEVEADRTRTDQSAASPEESTDADPSGGSDAGSDAEEGSGSSTRRRRRRRRKGEPSDPGDDEPENTVTKVRERKKAESEITSVEGSTRLEAKRQRRREGRDAGRRRPPILSESEFLARRESVNREMVIRQRGDLTQIAVLEDKVLVEHYVARESQTSLIGNVYLGRVQNVLPSMEAAFIDIGKGRNAVLYAGEVDWKSLGMDGKPRRVEDALSSGQHVLVQVTRDPVGHKGARLTGQISLPGRFLVYVPRGHTSGISRKLPEGERARLKSLLKDVLPADAGVIIRTAAEGATEEQLTRDVSALTARWDDITAKSANKGKGPQLLYAEPDLMLKVVRDLFTEDFSTLVVQGADAWDGIEGYVGHVAPDLAERCTRYEGDGDVFADYRVDEQIAKGLDRKVWLPSGGSLVIDRTEAMTVVDVNTGKFTGSGGNLEETVTKNNLEAAEEVVRQLRLRDIGGIIVVDFIDMVLESNRDLVLRRMVECLSRDRTRHQVAEVTSLGLVQMTRKKIGTGLLEAFGDTCEHCNGVGLIMHAEPVDPSSSQGDGDGGRRGGRRRGGRVRGADDAGKPEEVRTSDGTTPRDDVSQDDEPATDEPAIAAPTIAAPTIAATPAQRPSAGSAQQPVQPVQPFAPRTSNEPRLGDAITPRKKSPRKRVTRAAAPPG